MQNKWIPQKGGILENLNSYLGLISFNFFYFTAILNMLKSFFFFQHNKYLHFLEVVNIETVQVVEKKNKKKTIPLSYKDNTMAADDLGMQRARTSPAMT